MSNLTSYEGGLHGNIEHRGATCYLSWFGYVIDEMQSLLDGYWRWLRDQTSLREVRDYIEITTPFLDRHNDFLQIYARCHDGGFILTDDGYTFADLEQSGCMIDSPKWHDLLRTILSRLGVQINESTKELEVRASTSNFALRKHNLVQAMLAVNDLFYLAFPTEGTS